MPVGLEPWCESLMIESDLEMRDGVMLRFLPLLRPYIIRGW